MKNMVIFQAFHWYYSPEGNLWLHIKDKAAHLAELGITHVWLPPAYKSADGQNEPGYAVYDLYDLGEFDQKGSVRTRYGTRDEYLDCIKTLQQHGIQVLADIIFNHRLGADEQESVPTTIVDEEDRNQAISDEHHVEVFTRFTFPGRNKKYSDFEWNWHCFTGVCDDGNVRVLFNEHAQGSWDNVLEDEKGNFDYLLGADVEFRNPHVRDELKRWGEWYVETTGIDGFRLDALKHMPADYFPEWLDHLNNHFSKHFLCIGEYWKNDVGTLHKYIELSQGKIQLFDVPLHHNFYEAGNSQQAFDMRRIFDNTLTMENPTLSISFVDNHDTQPLQSLESYVEYWFKPLAYALILLREQGIPCVFYPDLYDAVYSDTREGEEHVVELHPTPNIQTLLKLRSKAAYGPQRDYFENEHMIGWVREGNDEMENSGMAVLMSNHEEASLYMHLGERNAGKVFYDHTGNRQEKVQLNEKGEGEFFTYGRSVSVWVCEQIKY